jgi:Domain of unknown function (DUF4405)
MRESIGTDQSRGRVWGNRPRLVIDLVLTISFLALMSVSLTGLLLHEWWGILLMAVVVIHLLAQWDWTMSSSRRFFRSLTGRIRFTYMLNWCLFVAAVLVFASGILISEVVLPGLGLPTARGGDPTFLFWRRLHTFAADMVVVLAGIHVGLNWRWVVSAVSQVLRLRSRRPGRAEVRA